MVTGVVLFQRLEDQAQSMAWDGGTAMISKGNGVYVLTVMGSSVPNHNNFSIAHWVYQAAATNSKGEVIGRSAIIFDDADLSACGKPAGPKKVPTTLVPKKKVPTTPVPFIIPKRKLPTTPVPIIIVK